MDCEICGKGDTELFLVSVEGTKLTVCRDCSRCGTLIAQARDSSPYTTVKIEEEPEIGLVDNYLEQIMQSRQKAGLSQEELAKKINEKINFVRKVENGELKPTDSFVKKLEKEFGIKLFQRVKKESLEKKKASGSLSLGDIAVIKK